MTTAIALFSSNAKAPPTPTGPFDDIAVSQDVGTVKIVEPPSVRGSGSDVFLRSPIDPSIPPDLAYPSDYDYLNNQRYPIDRTASGDEGDYKGVYEGDYKDDYKMEAPPEVAAGPSEGGEGGGPGFGGVPTGLGGPGGSGSPNSPRSPSQNAGRLIDDPSTEILFLFPPPPSGSPKGDPNPNPDPGPLPSPIPEPTTAFFGMALVAVCAASRRRGRVAKTVG